MPEITEQIVREAPEIEAYKIGLLKSAKGLTDTAVNLPGYNIAGFNPDQIRAFEQARSGIGAYQPYLYGGTQALQKGIATTGEAADVLRGADTRNQFQAAQAAQNAAVQGTMGAGRQLGQQDIQQYMNPYSNLVLQQQLGEMNRQAAMQQQALQGQAVRAGAFGGSREGIQRAELGRNLMQTQNQAIAQSLQQGYGQALGTAQQQQQAQLAAAGQLGNQAQGIGALAGQQYGIGQNMAQSLSGMGAQLGNLGVQQGALGQSAQQLGQQDVNFLYNIGQQQQALTQQQNDAQRNAALQQAYEPYQRLAFLSDIYKGAPSSQQSISAATAPTPSAFQQAVGTGIAGLAAGTAAKKAGLF
ncbi:MAG: hypothetical protein EBU08_00565 [Micrococcales bacterium]|nr:hypothetical protein [Micrococcales bacterium]